MRNGNRYLFAILAQGKLCGMPSDDKDKEVARLLSALKPKQSNTTLAVIERNRELIHDVRQKGYSASEIAAILAQSERLNCTTRTLAEYVRRVLQEQDAPTQTQRRANVATTDTQPTHSEPQVAGHAAQRRNGEPL